MMRRSVVLLCALLLPAASTLESSPQQPPDDVPVERAAPPPAAPPPQGEAPASQPAQPRQVQSQPQEDPGVESAADDYERRRSARPVFRMGGSFRLPEGEEASEVMTLTGDLTVDGRVYRDVVSVAGQARLTGTGVVNGSFLVIGGHAVIEPGARVDGDLIVIGAGLDAPGEFMPGGEHIVIEPAILGGQLDALVPWITQGLLWGRLIVPSLPWVWSIVALCFLAYGALNAVFDRPVRACALALSERPLSAFLAGLLVLLLSGPVLLLLTVSLVGIIAVPFVVCALLLAWTLGKVGVARWIGLRTIPEDPDAPASRLHGVRSFTIGFAVLCIAYMIPVLGLVVWTTVGVLGLGAASLAFIAGYRRENPAPPRVAVPPRPPVVPHDHVAAPAFVPASPADDPRPFPPGSYPLQSPPPEASVSEPAPAAAPHLGTPAAAGAFELLAFPHAAFRERLAAFLLDVVLVLLATLLLGVDGDPPQQFLLLLLAYHVGFWTWKGTTVGGIICQLRLVRVDGGSLRFVDALVRGLSSILSLAVLGLGGFWILRDPERQAWHDKVAATYVVKVPRHYPF